MNHISNVKVHLKTRSGDLNICVHSLKRGSCFIEFIKIYEEKR